MPQVAVGAVAAGLVAGTTVTAGVLAVGFSLTAFAGSLVLGGLSYALTPKPKKSAVTKTNQTVSVRQSDLTRKYVYGHTRVTTGYAHMVSTGVNKDLHLILMLCQGKLRSINEIWVNDYCIPPDWIDANGNVTQGRYSGKMIIRKHLGEAFQPADSLAVANMPEWTNNHRLDGIAYLYIKLTKDQDIYPNGLPNFSAIVEGEEFFDPRVGDNRWSTNISLFARQYMKNPTYGFGVFDEDMDELNVSAQANICDEIVTTQNKNFTVAPSGVNIGNNLITLDGDLLELQFGDRVQISSTGGIPGGLSSGTDYYVIPYQVLTEPRIGLATSLQNAMNKVYIDITSAGSGTITITKTGEPRYHGSGVIDTETPLSENINNIVNAMAGKAIHIGGFWSLLAGAWRTPATTYGIGDLRGAMGLKSYESLAESYNIVKGLFISQVTNYQASDYPSARYNQFIEDDGGIEAIKELNLPFVTRPTTAQRIAKIELFKGRQGIVFTAPFSTKMLQNQCGDNIYLTIDRLGWENKPFEITEFSFDVNDGSLITKIVARETAQEIFDWSSGEAIDFDPAPNTNLPNPFLVYAPTGVGYNSEYIETRDGDAVYSLILKWDIHPDAFVAQFGDFEIQYKLSYDSVGGRSTEDDWLPSFFVAGNQTETVVVNSSVNVYYDLRIRARNNLGVRSSWVTLNEIIIGESGGVVDTYDWGFVYDAPSDNQDWGFVYDAPDSTSEDWGFV